MGFDPITFVFELINFIVLLLVLERFVFRPVRAAIVSRRDELAATRAKASEQLELVHTRSQALDVRNRELDQLRERIFAQATAEAATERAKLLARAREDADAERARVQSMLEAEREAALGWVQRVTVDRGAELAGRILLELAPEAAHEALLGLLMRNLDPEQSDLAAVLAEGTSEADATFARLPTAKETEALKAALSILAGRPVRLTVTADDRLGAGVTLTVGDRVLDASVSGQLELVREDARRQLDGGQR